MYNIFNILSLLWKHNTFLFVYCTLLNDSYLGIHIYRKTAKQISKQNKPETGKKERKKEDKKRIVQRRT